ncbi:MAG: cell wall hydrolase [Phyllobacterium sp.]
MTGFRWRTLSTLSGLLAVSVLSAACTTSDSSGLVSGMTVGSVKKSGYAYGGKPARHTEKDRECLERAMFFEANRSSDEGLVAVGTVVMNRLESGQYADTICGVVGQKNQFAPGVLWRPMQSKALPDVQAAADKVLKGARHPALGDNAMFFHTAGLKFPYKNMHYVLVAGGNAFYEKRSRMRRKNGEPVVTQAQVASQADQQTQVAAIPQEKPQTLVAQEATVPAAQETPAMAFKASDAQVDAIGKILLTQGRPSGSQ